MTSKIGSLLIGLAVVQLFAFVYPASAQAPTCTPTSTVLACAQAAATSSARAEAAAEAMRRPSTTAVVTTQRSFGTVYQNTSGRTMVVTVSAAKNAAGNTMYLSTSPTSGALPSNGLGSAINGATVAATSFACSTCSASITAIVPPGNFYNSTNDGGGVYLVTWAEAQL